MSVIASAVVDGATGYAQRVRTAGHRLASDEPASRGGTDTGPAPYSLLLAALGACTSITLRMYAARKGWDLGAIEVRLRLHQNGRDGPQRIERELRFGAPLDDAQRARLLEIADKTPVTKTLRTGTAIETRVGPEAKVAE